MSYIRKYFWRCIIFGGIIPIVVIAAPQTTKEIGDLIQRIANFMSSLIGALSVVVILYAAFQYVTAAEDEDKVTDARKTITYAIVGLIVAGIAYIVPGIIEGIIG